MIYEFKQDETESIINRFGKDFYEKVLSDIEKYAYIWKLESFFLIPSYSDNLIFTCNSEKHGNAILKSAIQLKKFLMSSILFLNITADVSVECWMLTLKMALCL